MVVEFKIIYLLCTFVFLKMGDDDISIKGFLGGYPDGGLVEDLPWEVHGLQWVIREPIACKGEYLDRNLGRSSDWVCIDSK